MFLFDRQRLAPSDESGQKLPELFDIHVMLFADTSAATVAALQRAFSIDASSARKLVMQAPIVVKRAATPEVAAALFDVLAPLGAQVVLLPSSGVPIVKRVEPPADEPAHEAEAAAPVAHGWGGLEIELELPTPTPAWDELEIGTSDAPPDFLAQPDPAPPLPPPPPLNRRAPTSLPLPAVVAARRKAAPLEDAPADLGLGNVPPLPSMGAALSMRPSGKPPPVPRAATFAVSGHPPKASGIDFGSVSLPELSESLGTRRRPRSLETDPPPPATSSQDSAGRPEPRRSIASGDQGARQGSPRSTLRLDVDDARGADESGQTEATRNPGSTAQGAKAGPRPMASSEEPAGAALARTRVQAVAEIVLAILIVYMGLRTDHSVLHGNANMVWVALHGLALFSVGRAVAGLRS